MTPTPEPIRIREGSVLNGWVVQKEIMRTPLSELWKVEAVLPPGASSRFTPQIGALKVLNEELMQSQDMMDRFAQEITLLSEMRYEHVPPAIVYFPLPPRYAVVTKWIDGVTLEDRIKAHPDGMELAEIASTSVPILRTLHHMHAAKPQLIHRDIKPLNLMIDQSGKPFLIDFGIALVRGNPRLSRSGTIVGTPYYMAPEMIQRPSEISHSVDIYAFGIMLFEMATGRKPFDSEQTEWFEWLRELQHKSIYEQPPWVADFRPGIPEDFEFLVQKAIEKNPIQRWASCEEMARLLEQFLPTRPATATVLTSNQKISKDLPTSDTVEPQADDETPGGQVIEDELPTTPAYVRKWLQLAGAPGCFLVGAYPLLSAWLTSAPMPAVFWSFAAGGAAVSFASYLRLLYHAWYAIADEQTKTTPGQVVREHFMVPWTVVAIWRYFAGFGNNYNQFIERNQIDLGYMGAAAPNLFILVQFLILAGAFAPLVPADRKYLELMLIGGLTLIFAVMTGRICDAINDLADYRAMLQATAETNEVGV
jgi:serine/threonine protein kinase